MSDQSDKKPTFHGLEAISEEIVDVAKRSNTSEHSEKSPTFHGLEAISEEIVDVAKRSNTSEHSEKSPTFHGLKAISVKGDSRAGEELDLNANHNPVEHSDSLEALSREIELSSKKENPNRTAIFDGADLDVDSALKSYLEDNDISGLEFDLGENNESGSEFDLGENNESGSEFDLGENDESGSEFDLDALANDTNTHYLGDESSKAKESSLEPNWSAASASSAERYVPSSPSHSNVDSDNFLEPNWSAAQRSEQEFDLNSEMSDRQGKEEESFLEPNWSAANREGVDSFVPSPSTGMRERNDGTDFLEPNWSSAETKKPKQKSLTQESRVDPIDDELPLRLSDSAKAIRDGIDYNEEYRSFRDDNSAMSANLSNEDAKAKGYDNTNHLLDIEDELPLRMAGAKEDSDYDRILGVDQNYNADTNYLTRELQPSAPLGVEAHSANSNELGLDDSLSAAMPPINNSELQEDPIITQSMEAPLGVDPMGASDWTPFSSVLSGTHEAVEFQGASDLSLDIEESALPKKEGASSTLWEGAAVADPLANQSAEHSAEWEAVDESPERINAARDMWTLIDKTVRVLNLYEGKGKAVSIALQKASEQLGETLNLHGKFIFRVTPYEFMLGESSVYTADADRTGLTFCIFRDGVRELIIKPGIDSDELEKLIDVLRLTPMSSGENDSVTMLWEMNLTHIEYEAIDTFLEGMLDSGDDSVQREIQNLVNLTMSPLHLRETIGTPSTRDLAPLPSELIAVVERFYNQDLSNLYSDRMVDIDKDLWRRAMWVCLKLAEGGDAESSIVRLLAKLMIDLVLQGRWTLLASATASMREFIDLSAKYAPGKSPLDLALVIVAQNDKLVDMVEALDISDKSTKKDAIDFLSHLPKEGDTVLRRILDRVGGDLQELIAHLLGTRGSDMSSYHRSRLKHHDVQVVRTSLFALAKDPSDNATKAIKSLLIHRDWKIVLETLNVLSNRMSVASSDLVRCLESDSQQVRDQTLGMLCQLSAEDAAALELSRILLENEDDERWTEKQRRLALDILIKWGGGRVDEELVKTLVIANPFRRKKIEERRQEVFAAVQRVGGMRAKIIIETCLKEKIPAPIRKGMEKVLERLKNA